MKVAMTQTIIVSVCRNKIRHIANGSCHSEKQVITDNYLEKKNIFDSHERASEIPNNAHTLHERFFSRLKFTSIYISIYQSNGPVYLLESLHSTGRRHLEHITAHPSLINLR